MSWLIHVPVWGEDYHLMFQKRGLPSILAAIDACNVEEVHFFIHTDHPEYYTGLLEKTRPVPYATEATTKLGHCHRAAIREAAIDQKILLVNADMVVPRDVFSICNREFFNGHTFVVCPAIRTDNVAPPIGVYGPQLFAWSWDNRHRFTEDCVWGRGRVKLPPYVIFENGDNVVMHAWDFQPLAIHKTRELEYRGPTGSEIVSMFPLKEIYVPAYAELVVAETSLAMLPYDRFRKRIFDGNTVINWGSHFNFPQQQSLFRHQVILRGRHDAYAQRLANQWADQIDENIAAGRMPIFTTEVRRIPGLKFQMPSKLLLASLVPYRMRQLLPKTFRNWVKSWDWWQ